VAKDSKTPPKSLVGLPGWQQQFIALLVGCLLSVCWLAIHFSNPLVALIGLLCSSGFIWAFFHRQIKEEFLEYQGPSGGLSSSLATTPKIVVPEESLLLWLMVILLAITAFISLDIATHNSFSLLAIPFSIAGWLWSYRRRHLAKHWLTHLVFWAALVLVLFFLGSAFWAQTIERAKHFLGTDRDLVVPLALSFLLVALQTVRMWSLCYGRGLSSSVVISVVLMASTLVIGNNPGFLLTLVLFVGLLVPTLMLFYRSTIQLKPIGVSIVPRPQQLTERHVPWQYLTKIAALTLVLGCILALFAPHLRLPEVSWDIPGLDQLVKNLPIETDPTMVNNDPNASPDHGSESKAADESTDNSGIENFEAGEQSGSPQSGDTGDDHGFIEELQAKAAIENILATADRPLKTTDERTAYLTKYLQEHVSSTNCATNSLTCHKNFRLRSEHRQDELALWQLSPKAEALAQSKISEQIPLRSYYIAQQSTPKSSSLLEQLTEPCPTNQQSCYKERVFQVNEQEAIRTRNRLLQSIGGTDPKSKSNAAEPPGEVNDDQIEANDSSRNISGVLTEGDGSLVGKKSEVNKTPSPNKNNKAANSPTHKSAKGKSPQLKGRNISSAKKLSPKKQSKMVSKDRQKDPSEPTKPPVFNSEQLMSFLRVTAVILLLILGVIWYLWWQGRQERVQKQKDRKFNQRPLIERIYWLMLKELRATGSIKLPTETEWEFVLINDPQYPGLLGKLITEISHDYIAWHYGKKPPNEASLTQKFERFRELHSAELAKRQAEKNFISQSKKMLHLVK
jgi:hypothetical protein